MNLADKAECVGLNNRVGSELVGALGHVRAGHDGSRLGCQWMVTSSNIAVAANYAETERDGVEGFSTLRWRISRQLIQLSLEATHTCWRRLVQ